jgi:uncharacterized Zn-binding protein involved in type VI secretion
MPKVTVNPPKTPVTKGSNGIAAATIPNICKMPGPPAPFVPTPLPNIGKSGDSPKGYSTTVKIEGQPVAIKGATFGSMGDMASKGTGGGLVSSNTHGPTKFIGPGSMNVKIQGKNVQLLSDPMLNNCGPSGSPANAATLAGVLQSLLSAAQNTERPTTACSGGGDHVWTSQPASGSKSVDDKIRDSQASPKGGIQFEGAAAAHNKASGDLKRSDQLSDVDDNAEKIWWVCALCGFKREGDQLHDAPAGRPPVAVEVKSKTKLDARDAAQLGRNCQAVTQGGAGGLIYKVPAGPRANWLVSHIRKLGDALGVAIKVVRV